MITFSEYLAESKQLSSATYHSYTNSDGHKIDVHLKKVHTGNIAIFHNKNIGVVTKLVHWEHEAPTKEQLESDSESLNESDSDLSNNSVGKIAEHAAIIRMHEHLHTQNGTLGSDEHKADIAPHEKEIERLSVGKDRSAVELRKAHGRSQADSALADLKQTHGKRIQLLRVGHTANAGDIEKFTKGRHKDGSENPSDMAVEFKKRPTSEESQYHGVSLKSTKDKKVTTTKNPGINLDGHLNSRSRKLKAEEVSRAGLQQVRTDMGHEGKSAADMKRLIDKTRESEGKPKDSSVELEANSHAKKVKNDVAKELHSHIQTMIDHDPNAHHKIGKMLKAHLTSKTSMSWSKVQAHGDSPSKVYSTVSSGSASPLNKIFSSKSSRYAVSHRGDTVTIHHVHPETGELTPIAHYAAKPKANALQSDVHGWNVRHAKLH